MAIAFDAATDGLNNGGSGTLTFSHTATGSNLIGFVGLLGDVIGGADDISSVTWGGVAMTLIRKITSGPGGRFSYVYALAGPASGSQSIVVSSSSNHYLLAGAATYTGASQTGIPDNSTTNTAGTDPITTSLTTVADNCWTFLFAESGSGGTFTAGTGSTFRKKDVAFSVWGILDSGNLIHPAGSYSMTVSSLSNGVTIMCSFAPVGAGASVTYPQLERGIRGYCRGLAGMN